MKLIILDRDGVINYDSDQFIKSPDEWRPIPGSLPKITETTPPIMSAAMTITSATRNRKKKTAQPLFRVRSQLVRIASKGL